MRRPLIQILKESFGVSEEEISEARRIRGEKGGNTTDILVQKNIKTLRPI